jgi:hypothetical protein
MSWFGAHPRLSVIALAVLVRLTLLALLPATLDFTQSAVHGSEAYDIYAQNLLKTGVYGREAGTPDALLPPLYSYLLAGVYALVGRGYWQVGLLHTVLDALSLWLLIDIGQRLFARSRHAEAVGVLAALLTALYPYLVFQNLTLIDTPLFILLLHLFVWLLILLRDQPDYNRRTLLLALAAGAVLGVTTLARALLPPLAVLAAFWFLFRLNLWQTVLRLLPVALVSVLLLVPWIMRGYSLYDAFVPVALNSGENIYQGNNPQTVPLFRAGYDAQWSQPPASVENVTDRVERNRLLTQAGLDYLRENPDAIPDLLWTKFLVHWSVEIMPRRNPQPSETLQLSDTGAIMVLRADDTISGVTEANAAYDAGWFDTLARPLHVLYFGGLLLLSLLGIGLSWRYWRDVSLLWFVQISMTLMYVLFHPSTRYRVPSDPLLFLFAAYTLVLLGSYLASQSKLKDVLNRHGEAR